MENSDKAPTGLLILFLFVIIGLLAPDRPFVATIGLGLIFFFGLLIFTYFSLPDRIFESSEKQ